MRFIAPILTILFASNAWADKCGKDIPKHGICTAANQVRWCESGETHTLDCDEEEVCAWNEAVDAFDCLTGACSYDVDGDGVEEALDIEGECTPSGDVVWCEGGKLRTLKCGMGTVCLYNAKLQAHDCVEPNAVSMSEKELPDAGSSMDTDQYGDGDEDGDDKASGPDAARGTIPPIRHDQEQQPPSPQDLNRPPNGGCSAGTRPPSGPGVPAAIALSVLGLLVAIRRTRRVVGS